MAKLYNELYKPLYGTLYGEAPAVDPVAEADKNIDSLVAALKIDGAITLKAHAADGATLNINDFGISSPNTHSLTIELASSSVTTGVVKATFEVKSTVAGAKTGTTGELTITNPVAKK